jgi:hypothetical protein
MLANMWIVLLLAMATEDPALQGLKRMADADILSRASRLNCEWRETQRNQNGDGTVREKTTDVVILEGSRYRRLIARNGARLDPEERLAVELDENREAKLRRSGKVHADKGIDWLALLSTHRWTLAGPTLVGEPNTLPGKRYEIHTDSDGRILTLRTLQRGDGPSLLDGSTVESHFQPQPGGAWALDRVVANVIVAGGRTSQITEFSGYRCPATP